MNLLRVDLRNYRGVSHRDIAFSPTGVTVVEGPNETGKTSIAEAIDRVLEDLDSTSRKRVLALKPVGRDVGPEITIEIETGPYAFRYRKRFLRERLTELTVTRPRPRQLTGREAHECVGSMLAETVDLALWRALRIQQGGTIDQASLVSQASLSAALDRAAGEAPAGQEEGSLFAAAHEEYTQYWTETGRRKQEAAAHERAVESARAEVERIQTALRQIDEDVESSVRFRAEVVRLTDLRVRQGARVDELVAQERHLIQLEGAVREAEVRRDAASNVAGEARRAHAARLAMVRDLATASGVVEGLRRRADESAPDLEAAQARADTAGQALEAARSARDQARQHAQTMRGDLSLRRDERDLADLERRKSRVDAALQELHAAEETLAVNHVDAVALEDIETLDRAVALARSQLEAQQPLVQVEALRGISGTADGAPFRLTAHQRLERRVRQSFTLSVPGSLTLTVTPAEDDQSPAADLQAEAERFSERCHQAGATDAADARRLHRIFRDADQAQNEHRRVLTDALGELTQEALESALVSLRARVARYRETRDAEPRIPADEEAAGLAVAEGDRLLAAADREVQAAEQETDTARRLLSELTAAARERAVELRLATEKAAELTVALASERASCPDEQLGDQLRDAEARERGLDDHLRAAREELDRSGPEQVRSLLDNVRATLDGIDAELRAAEDGLLEVQTRLREHGEDGLAELRDEADAAVATAERERDQYQHRATARKILYETLRDEREAARRAYVGPLRERIDHLGSLVFGPDFGVELDESLRIVSRTIGDQTIPFESLSVGAQEQLGLITRLACAMIVSRDGGGVPLILDDALGNSDPQRLEAMGAVLSVAGRHCQIIVLTCQPERYQHVGGATLVRLA